jgi:hypothetical protein
MAWATGVVNITCQEIDGMATEVVNIMCLEKDGLGYWCC